MAHISGIAPAFDQPRHEQYARHGHGQMSTWREVMDQMIRSKGGCRKPDWENRLSMVLVSKMAVLPASRCEEGLAGHPNS